MKSKKIKIRNLKSIRMYSFLSLGISLISFFLFNGIDLMAQSGVSLYTELGKNNVSDGLFIKSTAIGACKFGKNMVETEFQFDLVNGKKNSLSAYAISASRDMVIKGIPFELKGFYIRTPFSKILCETNWGALVNLKRNHFEMTIGTNLKSFTIRQQAIADYAIDNISLKIKELYNIMYSFSYYLKPIENNWNLGVSVSNIDHFIINQETNPFFNIYGSYKLRSPVSLYAQACYKIAGISNLELNYFGYFVRTGIIWTISL
jgi:hypothetical protein